MLKVKTSEDTVMRWITLSLIIALFTFNACSSNSYNLKLRQAQNFLQKRNYDQAKTEINRLLEKYPEEPQPFYLLGTLYYLNGNYSDCLKNFDNAEQRGLKGTSEYYTNRGIALYHIGASPEAEKSLQQSITIRSSAIAHKYLGTIRYDAGDYDGAASSLTEASAAFSDDVDILYRLGMALYRKGNVAGSLEAFERALPLAPENDDIMFHTAHLLMLDEQLNAAASLFEKIPPESNYSDNSIYNAGEAYLRLGNYQSAAIILKKYIKTHSDDYEALYNLSAALIKNEDYTAAIDILSTLYERGNLNVRVAYNIGLAFQGLGTYSQSLLPLEFAVENEPNNTSYRYAYGLSLTENGEIVEAGEQIKSILSIDPSHENAREWLERYGTPEKQTGKSEN
jgi:tetratricopeptide (TPR) repeat protein